MTVEVDGVAHTFIVAGNFAAARVFYGLSGASILVRLSAGLT